MSQINIQIIDGRLCATCSDTGDILRDEPLTVGGAESMGDWLGATNKRAEFTRSLKHASDHGGEDIDYIDTIISRYPEEQCARFMDEIGTNECWMYEHPRKEWFASDTTLDYWAWVRMRIRKLQCEQQGVAFEPVPEVAA